MMRGGRKLASFEMLANALARPALAAARWHLVVAGEGPARREVEAAFVGPLAAGRVTFTGRVDAEVLASLYAGADLFVWPAVGEPMGMAMLEAQEHGLPVVSARTRGVPDLVRHEETGLLVPECDAGAFADAVEALLRAPERRRRMGRAARDRVAREHGFAAASDRIGKLIEGLVGRHRRSRRRERGGETCSGARVGATPGVGAGRWGETGHAGVTRLLFLRHGPTEWSEAGRIQGRRNVPLAPAAWDALAARRLPSRTGGSLRWVSSPLLRARQTAEALGAERIETEPRLTEMDWGRWEGRSLPSLREELGEAMRENEARGLDFETPAGDTPRRVQARLRPVASRDCGARASRRRRLPQGGGPGPARTCHRLGHEGEGAGPPPVGACPPVRGLPVGRTAARRAEHRPRSTTPRTAPVPVMPVIPAPGSTCAFGPRHATRRNEGAPRDEDQAWRSWPVEPSGERAPHVRGRTMTHVPWSGIAGGAGARHSPGWWLAHRYRDGSKSLPRVANRMNSDWAALEQEVDAWREAGREVTLWWRDDDAAEPSLALSRLLRLRPPGCPLGLAVIPAAAKATLAGELTGAVDVLVHGFAHANHAAPGARKSEYPAGRAAPDELREGRERLDELFGDRALPVFVPPWNRMGEDAAAGPSGGRVPGALRLPGAAGGPAAPPRHPRRSGRLEGRAAVRRGGEGARRARRSARRAPQRGNGRSDRGAFPPSGARRGRLAVPRTPPRMGRGRAGSALDPPPRRASGAGAKPRVRVELRFRAPGGTPPIRPASFAALHHDLVRSCPGGVNAPWAAIRVRGPISAFPGPCPYHRRSKSDFRDEPHGPEQPWNRSASSARAATSTARCRWTSRTMAGRRCRRAKAGAACGYRSATTCRRGSSGCRTGGGSPRSRKAKGGLSGAWKHGDAQVCADDPDFLDREQVIPHLKGLPCAVRPAAA